MTSLLFWYSLLFLRCSGRNDIRNFCHRFRLMKRDDYFWVNFDGKPILTTFKLSILFRCSWNCSVNWLEPKIEPPEANLACPNPWNALYVDTSKYVLKKKNIFRLRLSTFYWINVLSNWINYLRKNDDLAFLKSELAFDTVSNFITFYW